MSVHFARGGEGYATGIPDAIIHHFHSSTRTFIILIFRATFHLHIYHLYRKALLVARPLSASPLINNTRSNIRKYRRRCRYTVFRDETRGEGGRGRTNPRREEFKRPRWRLESRAMHREGGGGGGGGGEVQARQAGSAATSSNAHVRVAVRDRPGPLTYITRGVYRSRIYESRPTSDTRPRQVGAGRVGACFASSSLVDVRQRLKRLRGSCVGVVREIEPRGRSAAG